MVTFMNGKSYALQLQQPVWLATLTAASVAFSLGFACAVPLAAFAALGALTLDRRTALSFIAIVVLTNQVVGFTVLHYPRDPETIAWGAIFLFVGLLSTVSALWVKERCARANAAVVMAATFVVAFIVYEGSFFLASFASGSGLYAYAPKVMLRIFEVNVFAFAGLFLLDRTSAVLLPDRNAKISVSHRAAS